MKAQRVEVPLSRPHKNLKFGLKGEHILVKEPIIKKNTIPKQLMIQRTGTTDPNVRKKLVIRNDKHYSHISACDEDCISVIRSIRRNKGVKLLKSLAFDSSKCKDSGMSQLHRLLFKMTMLKKLDLTITKLNYRNECASLGSRMSRLIRMNALKMKFLRTENLSDYGVLKLVYGLRNCQLIKDYETQLVLLPELSHLGIRKAYNRFRIMTNLEKLTLISNKKLTVKNTQNGMCNTPYTFPRLPKVKDISYGLYKDSAWSMMTLNDSSTEFLPPYLESLGVALNPYRFHIKFTDYIIPPEAMAALAESLCKMTNLKSASVAFNNCKLGDLEVEYLSAVLGQFKCLEDLELIITEKSTLCPSTIFNFVKRMTLCESIKNIRIEIAMTYIMKCQSQAVKDKMDTLDNIDYTFIDEVLSVTRREV